MSTATLPIAETEVLSLAIEVSGEVISSNFPAFADMVRNHLAGFNRVLATDEEFDQADKDAGIIKGAEDSLKKAKQKALESAESLHALFDQIDGLSAELAAARLDLTNQIKKRKEEVKSEIVEEFLADFDIDPKDARRHYLAGLKGSISGKRSVESMRTACRIYQKTQQAMIIQARASIERFVGKFGSELVMDRRELELKNVEAVEAELVRRIEAKRAADEQAKLRKEAAEAKAEADKAKRELAESSKPPVPPSNVEQGPWGGEAGTSNIERPTSNTEVKRETDASETAAEETAAQEWAEFKAGFLAAFAPVKTAREGLKHSANIAKAQGLANGINQAWKEWA